MPGGHDRPIDRGAWRAEARTTLGLAWPLALTNLSQFALTLTDTLILGHYATEALAAAALGGNFYWACMAAPFGLALAAAPILAQARGAGHRADSPPGAWEAAMRHGARHALATALGLAALVLLPLWHAEWILRELLGQEPHLAALAGEYLRWLMWGLPAFCGFVVVRGFLAAMERPAPALIVSLAAIAVNAVLCWPLVFGAFGWGGMGVAGAGLSSTLANLFMLGALLLLVARRPALRRIRLLSGAWRLQAAGLLSVLRLGLPIAGAMLLEIGVFSAATMAAGWLGAIAVAAHAVAIQVSAMTFMVPMGIGQAATARVGLLAGAGDGAGAVRAGWVAIALGAGFMLAMALLLVLARHPIAAAFLGAGDAEAAAAAPLCAMLLIIAGIYQLADGVQGVAAGALRGLKDTRVPMLLAALGYWVIGLPLGLLLALPAGWGVAGIWVGLAAGLGVVAALLLRRWVVLSRADSATAAAGPVPALSS